MKLSLLFTSIIFVFLGYTGLNDSYGENIKISTNEGKNSLVFRCSYPTKYYQEILKDIQEYDPQFKPMEKIYEIGNGNANITFKSKGKLEIVYHADDQKHSEQKGKLLELTQQIGATLGENN